MSSTNRSRSADVFDRYPTPPRLARAGFDHLVELFGKRIAQASYFLEPGSGPGTFSNLASQYCHKLKTVPTGVEAYPWPNVMLPTCTRQVEANFLDWKPDHAYDLIVTNPPFKQAEAFIRRTVEIMPDHGIAMFLMRIGVYGAHKRTDLWAQVNLLHLDMLVPRPSFTSDGGNDSSEYAFFVFDKSENQRRANLGRVVWREDKKPAKERRR